MKNSKEGFTILEMIIIVSILALIFLLLLPSIQEKQEMLEERQNEGHIDFIDEEKHEISLQNK